MVRCTYIFFSWISEQKVPHVESSDSEQSYRDSDSETSESDEDVEEEINIEVEREYPKVPAPKVSILPTVPNYGLHHVTRFINHEQASIFQL